MSTATTPPAEEQQTDLGGIVRAYVAKVRGGDVGSLPAVLGLVALVIVFSILRPDTFTTELNFANLIGQSAAVMVLAMGLIFVLLLGEIDLSAGYTGGAAAAVLALTLTEHDWPLVPALIAGILTGTVIGFLIGLMVARIGIPSFVVTLALFLALQGVMLQIIGDGGTIGIRNDFVLKLNNGSMPIWLGWLLAVLTIVGYAGGRLLTMRNRRARGLVSEPLLLWALKSAGFAVIIVAVVGYLSRERSPNPALKSLKGVPNVVVIILILVVVLGYLLSRTSWGKHVYAVGGNAEAARRSGINVPWVKISCFMACSTIAALAGFLAASRTNSVSPNTGGSDTLLLAVGAAVIGGTSLFGGKGRITDAVIGGLVVAVIRNGIILLDQPSSVYYMVTGAVLLLAASVDAISRRRATASGRA